MVTDNGPQFISEEFAIFVKVNGVKHINNSPYHPATNGAVERLVQTFKKIMKASENDGRSQLQRLADFLLTYRSTPHATTHETPSDFFLKRKLQKLDLIYFVLMLIKQYNRSKPNRNRIMIITVEVVSTS